MSIIGRVVLLKLHTEDVPDIFCLMINGVVTPIIKLLRDEAYSKFPDINNREAYMEYYKKLASLKTIVVNRKNKMQEFKISSINYSMSGYGGDDHNAEESYSGINYEDSIDSNKKLKEYLLSILDKEVEIMLI
jgi:hypothetical protein